MKILFKGTRKTLTLQNSRQIFSIMISSSGLIIVNAKDSNTACDNFMKNYCSVLDKHAPLKKMTKKELKRTKKPWITNGLIKSASKKRSLLNKIKGFKLKNKDTTKIYKTYKFYTDTINKLKKNVKEIITKTILIKMLLTRKKCGRASTDS